MFTKANYVLLFFLFFIMLFGCATTKSDWQTRLVDNSIIDNKYFFARIRSQCNDWGCKSFNLFVKNKTNKNLELNWNKTLYIVHGNTSGGFMFEGILYKDRNNPKSPDIIFSGGQLSKDIWPNNLVQFHRSWTHEPMPEGLNGVYLTISTEGKEVSEKLEIILYQYQIQN